MGTPVVHCIEHVHHVPYTKAYLAIQPSPWPFPTCHCLLGKVAESMYCLIMDFIKAILWLVDWETGLLEVGLSHQMLVKRHRCIVHGWNWVDLQKRRSSFNESPKDNLVDTVNSGGNINTLIHLCKYKCKIIFWAAAQQRNRSLITLHVRTGIKQECLLKLPKFESLN